MCCGGLEGGDDACPMPGRGVPWDRLLDGKLRSQRDSCLLDSLLDNPHVAKPSVYSKRAWWVVGRICQHWVSA
jgi:hypothetical protein